MSYDLPDTVPPEAKSLIQMLIKFEPSMRLGVAECGGFARLKEHEFFKGVDWTNLSEQQPPSVDEGAVS